MNVDITSVHNPRLKQALDLRDRKGREAQQRIIIDGAREITRAMASGVELSEVFVCEELLRNNESIATHARLKKDGANLFYVSARAFEKLAYGDRGEGVIATAATPQRTLDMLQLPEVPLVAVLEGVEKPGNVGAVLRSADAAGVSALLIADGGTDLFNPNAIRASLGAIFSVPVCAATSAEVLQFLRSHQLQIFATRVDGACSYTDVSFRAPAAIVMGSEALGLTEQWRGDDIQPIQLPMLGVCDSLNVSTTAAVLFYEALRQRGR